MQHLLPSIIANPSDYVGLGWYLVGMQMRIELPTNLGVVVFIGGRGRGSLQDLIASFSKSGLLFKLFAAGVRDLKLRSNYVPTEREQSSII
jgi:hypothetical protein